MLKLDINQIIDLYNKGYSLTYIAKIMSCSRGTIKSALIKSNIKIRDNKSAMNMDVLRLYLSQKLIGKTKSNIHKEHMREFYRNNPEKLADRSKKMKQTKQMQSNSGQLSQRHFTKQLSTEEVNRIYQQIGNKASKTKRRLFNIGELVTWNKGITRFDDDRVKKWAGENHYRFNPQNKMHAYDDKFFNKKYRKYLLNRQGNKCFISGKTNDLILHHIDENKSNSNETNLIYLNRSVHTKLHNSVKFKAECDNKFKQFFSSILTEQK